MSAYWPQLPRSLLNHFSVTGIGAVVTRDGEQFHIAILRSYGKSFWHWLRASAAEFGAEFI